MSFEIENERPLSIAVLLTNHNTWALAQRCVTACFEVDPGNFQNLLVYDDSSTVEFTGRFPDGANLYRGHPNRGLTKSLNIAFNMIGEDIVVLFDSDAYPVTPFCDVIRSMFTADPHLGLVALQTVGTNGRPTQSMETEPNVWGVVLGQALSARFDRWITDRSGRITVFTCAMAVRKRAFDQLNGFDEAFDWLDLDHDFSMRMSRAGWKIGVASAPRAFHEGGGTPQLASRRVERFYRNRWYLLNKFSRIRFRKLARTVIVARLSIELGVLLLAGKFLFSDRTALRDKIAGRRNLIRIFVHELR
jgi:GT2 family glycosyltransferase